MDKVEVSICVLRHHVEKKPDWETLEPLLKGLNIGIIGSTSLDIDGALLNEIIQAYFGGVYTYRQVAELLAYGRKHIAEDDDVQIISQLRIFRLIPGVQQYYIPTITDRGKDEEALYLRAVDALNINRRIWHAAESHMQSGNYSSALLEAINVFYKELRQISGSTEEGSKLIDETLAASDPLIKLTKLSSLAEQNEQQGYADFSHGFHNAIHTVLSHHLGDKDYLHKRFGDRRTALKFLCMLSLLFEKLDKRVAP